MEKIIFVTQTLGVKSGCGIGLIGKLLGESLIKSDKYNVELLYTDNPNELETLIITSNPSLIIYNYHQTTTSWVNNSHLRDKYPNIKHVMIHHDIHQRIINTYTPSSNFGFKYVISPDPTLTGSDNFFIVNRLIPPYSPLDYVDNGIPKIGFQGFGPKHKGIHKIAEQVQKEFDEAIIRLHIPFSYYEDPHGIEARNRVSEVKSIIKKPGIKIESSHDLLSTSDIIKFLSENTINCYFYDYLDGAGLASSPDYALAARRPIAVTKSHQLRNYQNLTPSICIEDNSLSNIISFGLSPLNELYTNYSEENVIKDYENVIKKILE
jgi:hypothetical protein